MAKIHIVLSNSAGELDSADLNFDGDADHGITKALINWLERELITLDEGDVITIGTQE